MRKPLSVLRLERCGIRKDRHVAQFIEDEQIQLGKMLSDPQELMLFLGLQEQCDRFGYADEAGPLILSAGNGYFEYTCYHPLFLFNQFGNLGQNLRQENGEKRTGDDAVRATH